MTFQRSFALDNLRMLSSMRYSMHLHLLASGKVTKEEFDKVVKQDEEWEKKEVKRINDEISKTNKLLV